MTAPIATAVFQQADLLQRALHEQGIPVCHVGIGNVSPTDSVQVQISIQLRAAVDVEDCGALLASLGATDVGPRWPDLHRQSAATTARGSVAGLSVVIYGGTAHAAAAEVSA